MNTDDVWIDELDDDELDALIDESTPRPRTRFFACYANGGAQPHDRVIWRVVPNRRDRRAPGQNNHGPRLRLRPIGTSRHRNKAIEHALKNPAVIAAIQEATA